MDGSAVEHSDSDSGDSWILLESNAPYAEDAPEFPEYAAVGASPNERENIETQHENDEDTDGISIITDSEPESTHGDVSDRSLFEENRPAEQENIPLLANLHSNNNNVDNESVRAENERFLRETTARAKKEFMEIRANDANGLYGDEQHKVYVHRRNNRVGSILDIIVLGAIVITTGMAIGHLWGYKNECASHPSSVNKILSNLYKLQEENAHLRNKLNECQRNPKFENDKQQAESMRTTQNQLRCTKIYEEPLDDNSSVGTKCIEYVNDPKYSKMDPMEHKNAITQLLLQEDLMIEADKINNVPKDMNLIDEPSAETTDSYKFQTIIPLAKPDLAASNEIKFTYADLVKTDSQKNVPLPEAKPIINDEVTTPEEKKSTYAESLKTDQTLPKMKKNERDNKSSRWIKRAVGKRYTRKSADEENLLNLNSYSEDDIKKDDRYTGPKIRQNRKKHDRQKLHKKQKRNNKYEQWEMKGGYLRDYDDISVVSQDNDNIMVNNPEKKFLNAEFETYVHKFTETEHNASINKDEPKKSKNYDEKSKVDKHLLKAKKGKKNKNKDSEWYDKRSALRAEARSKLEYELFGQNTSNNAAWYFRRMQKREQCRGQKDNSTIKKFSKRKMNFKMKR